MTIRATVAEEGDGTVQQIRSAQEFRKKGYSIGDQPAEAAYTKA